MIKKVRINEQIIFTESMKNKRLDLIFHWVVRYHSIFSVRFEYKP